MSNSPDALAWPARLAATTRAATPSWPLVCVLAGALFFGLAMIGSTRSLGFDEATSFAYFIATPSPFDVFGRGDYLGLPLMEISTNNHPLFNFIEHLLFSASHLRAEWIYRVLPAACAAACVTVIGLVTVARAGVAGSSAAMLFLATNPMFDDEAHALRGYTLFLVAVLLATACLRRRWGAFYALCVAVALATHLYLLLVLPAHVLLAHRWWSLRRALPWMLAGIAGGAIPYVGLVSALAAHTHSQGQVWRPDFPFQMVAYLTGGPVVVAFALIFALVPLGIFAERREPALWGLLFVYAAVVVFVWYVMRPAELYPRFFFFLLPGVAWLVGAAVRRWPLTIAIVVAAAGVSIVQQAPESGRNQLPIREAAVILDSHPGGCIIARDQYVMPAYTRRYTLVSRPDELSGCSYVVAVTWTIDAAVARRAAGEFPVQEQLPAIFPGYWLRRA